MSLNIKNAETHELAKQLAALKGMTLTSAVTLAVREELEREKMRRQQATQPARPKRSEILMKFAQEYSERVENPIHSWDIDSLLYGEDGLPK